MVPLLVTRFVPYPAPLLLKTTSPFVGDRRLPNKGTGESPNKGAHGSITKGLIGRRHQQRGCIGTNGVTNKGDHAPLLLTMVPLFGKRLSKTKGLVVVQGTRGLKTETNGCHDAPLLLILIPLFGKRRSQTKGLSDRS